MNNNNHSDVRSKLAAIFAREKQCIRIPLADARIIKHYQGVLDLNINGRNYSLHLRASIMQHLAHAAWGVGEYAAVKKLWKIKSFERNFIADLQEGIRKSGLHLILSRHNGGYSIYGMAPGNFEAEDQNVFRDSLLHSLTASQSFQIQQSINGRYETGEVWECFNILAKGRDRMQKSLVVVYGLNNGLSSYRMYFKRKIISCTNELTNSNFDMRWKHNSKQALREFTEAVALKACGFSEGEEQKIQKALGRTLERRNLHELFSRLHMPESVKVRLRETLQKEVNQEGNNEFALSQAMTWLATHAYGSNKDPHHSRLMKRGGSALISQPLQEILAEPVPTIETSYGPSYDWLLPHKNPLLKLSTMSSN